MNRVRIRLSTLIQAFAATILIGGCATQRSPEEWARATQGYVEDINKLFVVDCLLPGQVRRLGSQMTYLSARRPIRTTASDCEVRGGEYVAYDRANYSTALKIWLPKAEEGDAEAQQYVGQIYEKGLGQAPDYGKAAQWYRKAATQGNAQAEINLGHLYEKGLGVPKNSSEAFLWYGKAAGLEAAGIQYAAAEPAAAAAPQPPSDSRREVADLNRRSQAQQAENQRLRQENERLKAQLQESETLRTQLRATENQLVAQQEATQSAQSDLEATRRRLQEQKPAAAKPETRVIVEKDPASARLEAELREKEAQLAAQQRSLAQMTDSVSRERQAMQRELAATQADLEAARRKLRQEQAAASKPPAPEREPQIVVQKDADSARLEAELREKEAQLKSQQRKLADMTQSMKRERQTMRKQLEASRRAAEKAQAAPSAQALGQANSRLTELETKLAAKTEDYQKKSASLTGLLTSAGTGDAEKSRAEIDTLKQSLQADAREIAGLREQIDAQNRKVSDLEKQGTVLAAAGPDIQILEPPVNQTRGVPAIQLGSGMREITGRIAAPDGVASFQVENQPVAVDAAGAFRIPVQDDWLGRAIKLSASDKKNRSSVLSLSLLSPEGAAAPVSAAAPTAPLPVSAKSGQFGGFYALIIGNNDYASYQDLKTPASDAKSIDVVLRERYGFKTKVLLNANRYAIMTALNDLKGQLTENDNLLIYYAGHGEIDPGTQTAYWLPTDAETGNRANWISSESITEFISIMPARHIMVIADSCYSGAMAGSAVAKLPDGIDESKRDKWLNVMASRKSRTVLTSGDVKPVLDTGSGDHSVFAQAFLKVLRSNQGILEDYRLYGEVLGPVQSGASKAGFSQTPQYAPIQHAGHEGSPFFFVPAG